MSSSALIKIDDEVMAKWQKLKTEQSLVWLMLKIDRGTLVLDAEGAAPEGESQAAKRQRITSSEDWEEFRQRLSSATDDDGNPGARYALYDLRCSGTTNKPVFIAYVPDACSVKTKMIYASSKESLKSQIGGEGYEEIQANDAEDIEFESLKKALGRRTIG